MTHTHDQNQQHFSSHLVEYSIVAHPQAVKLIFACELLDTGWKWVLRQRIDSPGDPAAYRAVEGFEIALRFGRELNPVSQLDAQLFLDLIP